MEDFQDNGDRIKEFKLPSTDSLKSNNWPHQSGKSSSTTDESDDIPPQGMTITD